MPHLACAEGARAAVSSESIRSARDSHEPELLAAARRRSNNSIGVSCARYRQHRVAVGDTSVSVGNIQANGEMELINCVV